MKKYSIDVVNNIGKKAEELVKGCYKHRLQVLRPKFEEARPGESFLDSHRDPDTINGFLSLEDAVRLLSKNDPNQALHQCGLTIIANDDVMFLSDDSTYADKVLGTAFMGVTFSRPNLIIGDGLRYSSVHAFVEAHKGDTVLANSVLELATYLVTGDLPEREQPEKLFVTKVGMTPAELLEVLQHSAEVVKNTPAYKIPVGQMAQFIGWNSCLQRLVLRYHAFVVAAFPENIAETAFSLGAMNHPTHALLENIADGDASKWPVFYEMIWASVRNTQ